ncbi:TIGR02391 family protein [Candidatus Poriferisodalis sp.]|uniref:TIGR02391 family protein n=1 Tax=Candidatus Poriferisodalis sp. TaxID=3101277 RepID=UPI003AF8FC80
MNSVNVDLAKEQVTTFLRLLRENLAAYKTAFGKSQSPAGRQASLNRARSAAVQDASQISLLRLHPLIEETAETIDPRGGRDRFKPLGRQWQWDGVIAHAERLAGILDQQETREALFEPSGPRLRADRLHRWVWDAARNLWDDGHYGHAVHDATKAVERQTQIKARRQDVYGKDMYSQAFSTKDPEVDAPRLRFTEIDKDEQPQRWTSAHEGAQFLGMGCAQGIRNPQAHGTDGLDEQEALEQLAALSVLARWVESSELVEHVSA